LPTFAAQPSSVPKTAVVILNWNTKKYLKEFLPEVIRYSPGAEIIVADNASTDDSVEFIRKNYPIVKIIINQKNEGFAGGYNEALKQVSGDYFVLLNSDVRVTKDWLKPLENLLDNNLNIAAVQPKILTYYQPDTFEYAGAGGGFIDKYGYPFCRGRIFGTFEKDSHQYDDTIPVFWATGACMMIRSRVFNELGGFDAGFFAHMEEIDLCWRIHRKGYEVYYCGNSSVYHVGGGTLSKESPYKTFLNFRNNLLMIYKNLPKNRSKAIFKVRFLLDLIASMKFLLSGNAKNFKAVWQARSDFRKLKNRYQRPESDSENFSDGTGILIYPKSIVRDYYLWGSKKFTDLKWVNSQENTRSHR
jgi:GT2 family glycosyltransferase